MTRPTIRDTGVTSEVKVDGEATLSVRIDEYNLGRTTEASFVHGEASSRRKV